MLIPKFDLSLEDTSGRLCFACGTENPIGLKLKPYYDGEKVRAEFIANTFHQGWTNAIHGGITYTLLDEVTAYTLLCHGIDFGVTAKSEIRFLRPVEVGQPIKVQAQVTKNNRRLLEVEAVLSDKDGSVIAKTISHWRLVKDHIE